jgi:hypothetical protein
MGRSVVKSYQKAGEISAMLNVDIDTMQYDEIMHSRSYKGMNIMYSTAPNQELQTGGLEVENGWQFLTD